MNFLQRFDSENLKQTRAYRFYSKGSSLFKRFGVMNFVFLGVVGFHVIEHYKARWEQPNYYRWTFLQFRQPTRKVYDER